MKSMSRVPVLSWKSSNKSFSIIIIEQKREGNRRIDLRLPQIESYDFPDSRLLPVLPTVGHFDRIAKIDIRSSRNRNLATSISRHHVNALWLIVRRSTTRFSLGGQRKLSSVRAVFLISPQILKETRMASSRTCDWFQKLILNEVL